MSHDDCFQVLVVEDDVDAQANLRDILQLDSFEFEIVATGEQALRCCLQMDYAAIVIDWTLPDMTGEGCYPSCGGFARMLPCWSLPERSAWEEQSPPSVITLSIT